MSTDTPQKREAGKQERRNRILYAARTLLLQKGNTDFSMKELANTAAVSLVTPYSLFGSKNNIILELLNRETGRFSRLVSKVGQGNSLLKIFALISVATSMQEARNGYYKTLTKAYISSESENRQSMSETRIGYYSRLIDEAFTDGWIESYAPRDAIVSAIGNIFIGSISEYCAGAKTIKSLENDLISGFSMILYSVATRKSQMLLWQVICDPHIIHCPLFRSAVHKTGLNNN